MSNIVCSIVIITIGTQCRPSFLYAFLGVFMTELSPANLYGVPGPIVFHLYAVICAFSYHHRRIYAQT